MMGLFRLTFGANGSLTLNDQASEYALSPQEVAQADDFQTSERSLQKFPGFARLMGLTATGYAVQFDGTAAEGISFPDHADYDLGLEWTIHVVYKATTVPASGTEPITWRADDSNNKVTTLEINDSGQFVFTHRDSGGTEKTLTSTATISDGEQAHICVKRFRSSLRMLIDGDQDSTRSDLSATLHTAPVDNKWYVGVGTVTDGDTVTAVDTCVGFVDEFRVWRDEVERTPAADTDSWCFSEYPWITDERLVLYAKFNETTGSVTDYSNNENHGTYIGGAARDGTALVTALHTIKALEFFRAADGTEKWCAWSDTNFYAKAVQ